MPYKTNTRASQAKLEKGIALLEALIALLIFSFGVLGIVGLQSSMVKGTTQAKMRSDASYIAQRRIAAMWADPANLDAAHYNNTITVPELPSGTMTTVVSQVSGTTEADVTVSVSWTVPGEPQHGYSVQANISPCNNAASCI